MKLWTWEKWKCICSLSFPSYEVEPDLEYEPTFISFFHPLVRSSQSWDLSGLYGGFLCRYAIPVDGWRFSLLLQILPLFYKDRYHTICEAILFYFGGCFPWAGLLTHRTHTIVYRRQKTGSPQPFRQTLQKEQDFHSSHPYLASHDCTEGPFYSTTYTSTHFDGT